MILEQLKIRVRGKVVQAFKKSAKEAFPNETFAYLLGTKQGRNVVVESLYYPEDVGKYCDEYAVHMQPGWLKAARKAAREWGLEVIGDIHSHPYEWSALKAIKPGSGLPMPDCAPSEMDWNSEMVGIVGICLVTEQRGGKKTSRVKFWAPMTPPIAVIE